VRPRPPIAGWLISFGVLLMLAMLVGPFVTPFVLRHQIGELTLVQAELELAGR
jgi:hypothetical protein